MIPTLGNFCLWLGLLLSIVQLYISRKKNSYIFFKLYKITILSLLISILGSFISLIYSYIVSDFTIVNVFQNSHTTIPLIYKISGVWGNHEGSMILWILVLAIFNYFIFMFYKSNNAFFISKTLEYQSYIIFGFILFTIITSNPFERIVPFQENGLGFNPILQDPALAIHPPLLYIGYVGFSAVFSMSLATLSSNKYGKIQWYKYMKPFVITAWTFLSIGIAFGSLWAYYELGWGGWWFWDPVENASFMPWLLGTALLHSLIIVEKRQSLQTWALLLAILTFLFSVLGTFLVRSGILTSVHTFALDPSRGIYILTFTAILATYSLILFSKKSKYFLNKNYFTFFSKEGAILINNIFMVIVCATVFLGTIYPLMVEAIVNSKISVGEPYYNSTVIPIIIPAILVMGIGPILSWGKQDKLEAFKKIIPSIFLTSIFTIIFFLIYKKYSLIGIFGIIISFWIISNNIMMLIKKDKKYSFGMIIAHLGIGLVILGVTGSSVWQNEKIGIMKFKDKVKIENYEIILEGIDEIKGPNYYAIRGNFTINNNEKSLITQLNPENRFYINTEIFTTEASIHSNLLRDLYIVLGKGNLKDGWIVKIYYNPLVMWLWIGAILIFLGGIISIKNNLSKYKII